jgi:hypothetical protein
VVPRTKSQEPVTDEVIRLTAGHQAKVEEKPKGPVSARALDGPSAPRRLSAMPCESRPALTEVELFIMPPEFDQLYGLTEEEIRIVEVAQ